MCPDTHKMKNEVFLFTSSVVHVKYIYLHLKRTRSGILAGSLTRTGPEQMGQLLLSRYSTPRLEDFTCTHMQYYVMLLFSTTGHHTRGVADPNPQSAWNRIDCGRLKMTQKHRKKWRNFMFWCAGCSLLRTEGFSCSLDGPYGGLWKSKLQLLIK